mgnify:CR=1 FL=1
MKSEVMSFLRSAFMLASNNYDEMAQFAFNNVMCVVKQNFDQMLWSEYFWVKSRYFNSMNSI